MSVCGACASTEGFIPGEACVACGHVPVPVGIGTPRLSIVPALFPLPQLDDLEGVAMSEDAPAVSPTGKPVIDSQAIIKAAAALVGIAAIGVQTFPPHTVAFKVCAGIVALGSAFGIVSQGVRK